ncbi:MAG: hypothetical protein R3B08_12535 [Nitrospira sp.]
MAKNVELREYKVIYERYSFWPEEVDIAKQSIGTNLFLKRRFRRR